MVMERAGFASKIKQTLAATPGLLVTAKDITVLKPPTENIVRVGLNYQFH
jgi:hypothetical protein